MVGGGGGSTRQSEKLFGHVVAAERTLDRWGCTRVNRGFTKLLDGAGCATAYTQHAHTHNVYMGRNAQRLSHTHTKHCWLRQCTPTYPPRKSQRRLERLGRTRPRPRGSRPAPPAKRQSDDPQCSIESWIAHDPFLPPPPSPHHHTRTQHHPSRARGQTHLADLRSQWPRAMALALAPAPIAGTWGK
jgi:hypothetical protein